MSSQLLMPKRTALHSTGFVWAFIVGILVVMVCLSGASRTLAYKIEISVSGPVGGDSVSEENGRTEIRLDTGPVIAPGGEAGSAYATANLATGSLALKVTSTTPDQNSQSGMGLASIHLTDHVTFSLDSSLSVADIKFSMRVDGLPSCQDVSSNCFTNAIIHLGSVSDQALGLPLPDPKVLEVMTSVVNGQTLSIEAFLSARVEMNNLIDLSDPSAAILLTLPKGVSFTSESGVFLGLQPPVEEPLPRAPVSSDLNGDGKADIIWRNVRTGQVAVWLMNGGLIGASGFLRAVSSDWKIVGAGDVNNDGMADIVWRNILSGAVAIWFLNGLTVESVGFPGIASLEWVMKAVGDMDGDGSADFLWRNTESGAVAMWLMDGPTITAFRALPGIPLAWHVVGIGDVNTDGRGDIIWRHAGGTSAVWVMDELAIGSVKFLRGTSPEWEVAGLGDLNGNGTTDLVWRNNRTGMVRIWLMNGGAIDTSGSLTGLSSEWRIAQVGDADGDGKADVIWHNRSTGQVAVWLMDGLTLLSTEFPGSI